jgi:hypothetical protein
MKRVVNLSVPGKAKQVREFLDYESWFFCTWFRNGMLSYKVLFRQHETVTVSARLNPFLM